MEVIEDQAREVTSKMEKQQFHYFASNYLGWGSAENMELSLKRAADAISETLTVDTFIWYVPLPEDAPYEINFYAPQVKGARVVRACKINSSGKIFEEIDPFKKE